MQYPKRRRVVIVSFLDLFAWISYSNMVTSLAAQVNKIVSSTPSKNQQQQQVPTAASVLASSGTQNSSSGNSNNSSSSSSSIVTASGHNPAVQPHAPTPGLNTSGSVAATGAVPAGTAATAAAAAVSAAAVTSNNSSNTNNLQGQSVIQATPTIAFAAVAKHNTCKYSYSS